MAGNLVYDGRYVYRYDAFCRLHEVREPGTAVFRPDGRLADPSALGRLAARFSYDSLGRLMRAETSRIAESYSGSFAPRPVRKGRPMGFPCRRAG